MDPIPNPASLHPLAVDPWVVFLKPLIQAPNIVVGDFSYDDDPDDPTGFERNTVLYGYGPERLAIGKYCAQATGMRFTPVDVMCTFSGSSERCPAGPISSSFRAFARGPCGPVPHSGVCPSPAEGPLSW